MVEYVIKSPCIKVCKLHKNACIGCYRSIEEIKKWNKYSQLTKLWMWVKLYIRRYEKTMRKLYKML